MTEHDFLPKDDAILAACLFSFLLHLPVVVGVGVYVGSSEKASICDITAIIESATGSMRALQAAEPILAPALETTGTTGWNAPTTTTKESQRLMPSVSAAISTGSAFEDALSPGKSLDLPVSSLLLPAEDASRRWSAWYAAEVRRRIKEAFPYKPLVEKGIFGKVVFRISLAPDGEIAGFDVLQAEHPGLAEAARIALRHSTPFPSYASLGLSFFPPFDLTVRVVP